MIVSELKLYNFRRFNSVDGDPGLEVTFHKGMNKLEVSLKQRGSG